jgi:hypothetical protein
VEKKHDTTEDAAAGSTIERLDWSQETLMLSSVLLASTAVFAQPPDWARDVRPVLARQCFRCHGADPETRMADLRLDQRDALLASGVIDLEHPEASILLERIHDHEDPMPPTSEDSPLSPAELDVLRAWVDAGAPINAHWAFEPPRLEPPPFLDRLHAWPTQPLDAFVADGLEQAGLTPSPDASPARLLRRASLDLRGLPPTEAERTRFLEDTDPDAWEHAVDRLLESPHYGEHWAARWLDLARYADTQGYEQDGTRTMWPWRDWVIRAFNEDLPFDDFTIVQLAGDLLPNATDEQVLATGFHRNTMTNSEGGTRDEEFRVAAVLDRVNTTYETWMGLTMSCAQCHAHKYDPISQVEYYASYDLLNQTSDADRGNDAPHLAWQSPGQKARVLELTEAVNRERTRLIASNTPDTGPPSGRWLDDALPPGATPQGEDATTGWPWRTTTSDPTVTPFSGLHASESTANGEAFSQHFFDDAAATVTVAEHDVIEAHVLLDPDRPPKMIMVQVHTAAGGWEHRAYWGENRGLWGTDGTESRLRIGELPPSGSWVRLEISPDAIGLPPGTVVDGIALTQFGGHLWWDAVDISAADDEPHDWLVDRSAWEAIHRASGGRGLDTETAEVVRTPADERTPKDEDLLEANWLLRIGALGVEGATYRSALEELTIAQSSRIMTPVMQSLPEDERRTTHLLNRGAWNDPGEVVEPGIPESIRTTGTPQPTDRLEFARWIASTDNPLTARVRVNRLWESLFGRGLVETSEDFGTQGELPSNQRLLDHLALRFIELGWSQKAMLKEILTSRTYRQDSATTPERIERDPYNILLARGPRFRLDAETIRDQALAVSGLLEPSMHGPPVYPAQPEGTWQVVYNGGQWTESPPGDRHRRGLYTFWRRTAPYPSMVTFDAPSREFCVSRRIRTNTPLQALVVLNDPVYLEAAAALAGRMSETIDGEVPEDRVRVARGFRHATGREATPDELETLVELLDQARARFAAEPSNAALFIESCRGTTSENPTEFAAWIVLGNVLLNLDEVLVKS